MDLDGLSFGKDFVFWPNRQWTGRRAAARCLAMRVWVLRGLYAPLRLLRSHLSPLLRSRERDSLLRLKFLEPREAFGRRSSSLGIPG